MIIEVEDRFCKVAKAFSQVLGGLQRAAARGEAVHAVEEMAWSGLTETGRQMIAAYIAQQEEDLPRPEVIEHEGKPLHRLPARRTRSYVSAFGPKRGKPAAQPSQTCAHHAHESSTKTLNCAT